jgi:sugar phosphate isomerase/epimerase
VQWVLDAVDSPNFRLNFDNSHFEVMGCDFHAYVPQLTRYAVHTHMKDQRGIAPGFEFLVPGEGTFDYAAYLPAIEKAGYNGAITVEISKMVQNRPDYDPAEVAARSYRTLTDAAKRGGVTFAPVA